MAKKKILLVVVLILTIILSSIAILPIYAAEGGFTVTHQITQSPSIQNRTATIVLSYSGNSTNAIGGTISYDTNFFESVKMNTTTGIWSTSFENSKFASITMEANPPASGEFVTITATVKSDTTLNEGTITLTNLDGGDAGKSGDVTIKVKLQGNNDTSGQGSTTGGQTSTGTTNTATKKDTTASTKKISSLPKTGIASWTGIFIIAAVIVAIIEFVKYKRSMK